MGYDPSTGTHYRDGEKGQTPASHEAKIIFDKFDKDKSGSMDRKEIRAMLEDTFKAFGMETTEKDIDDMLNLLDKDGDGKVSCKSLSSLFLTDFFSSFFRPTKLDGREKHWVLLITLHFIHLITDTFPF